MDSPAITLSSKISFWTQYRATRAVVNRLWTTYVAWTFFVGAPLLFIVLAIGTGQDVSAPGAFGLPGWTVLLGGLLFMLGLVPLIQLLNVAGQRRRNPSVGGVMTYTITPEGYAVQGSLFDTKIKWEAFLKARETRDFILLYVSTRWAHFVPKAVLGASDLQAIRAVLREKLGTKAKLQGV